MTHGHKLRIKVSPDIIHNPNVKLDNRDPDGKPRIRWEKADGADHFDFVGFAPITAPLENPFQKIKINKNRIKCYFEPSDADKIGDEYSYILVIEYKGIPYNTTDTAAPNHGRAVIRN